MVRFSFHFCGLGAALMRKVGAAVGVGQVDTAGHPLPQHLMVVFWA